MGVWGLFFFIVGYALVRNDLHIEGQLFACYALMVDILPSGCAVLR